MLSNWPPLPDRPRWMTSLLVLLLSGGLLPAADALRVGVTPTTPPMIFQQNKELVGVDADFARALSKAIGRPLKFVEVKWEDQIPSLVNGKTDIIMSSMSVTLGRSMQVNFSTPYLRVGQMALVRGEDRGRYLLGFPASMSANIGVKKATTGDFLVQQEWPKAKRKAYKTGDDAARALVKKRIDLFIADATLIWWLSGTYEAEGLTNLPFMLSNEELAWAVRKSDTELLEQANSFLAEIRETGEYESIIRRWLPQKN
jgi:ABC-type amino acid transport substrate-binding protein